MQTTKMSFWRSTGKRQKRRFGVLAVNDKIVVLAFKGLRSKIHGFFMQLFFFILEIQVTGMEDIIINTLFPWKFLLDIPKK